MNDHAHGPKKTEIIVLWGAGDIEVDIAHVYVRSQDRNLILLL